MLQLIQQLACKHWCAVPLLFISQALSKLPPSPLLGIEGLTALRYIVRFTVRQTDVALDTDNFYSVDLQGGAALHHDHSSNPAERCCSVLLA